MSEVRVDFTGRTVIVTGAARGIGLSVAKRFQAAGGTVVAVDHDADGLNAAAAAIGAIAAPADGSRTDDAAQVVALAVERTGRVDVLVNNAGILRDKVLWKLIDDDWETVLGVHAGGTFPLYPRLCPALWRTEPRAGRERHLHRLARQPRAGHYATAKAAITGFTMTSAKELADFGVTVNAISPSAATRMRATIAPKRVTELPGPIQLADPVDTAAAMCLLAGDQARFITGVTRPVDGGVTL